MNNKIWGTLKVYKRSQRENYMHKHTIEPFEQSGNTLEKIVLAMLKHMVQRGIPCALYSHIWFDLLEPYLEVEIRQIFNPLFLTNC